MGELNTARKYYHFHTYYSFRIVYLIASMLPITQGFVSESQRLEHESTIRAVNVLSKTAAVEETLIGSMQDMRIDVLERNTAIAAEMQELQEKLESVYQYLQEKVIPQRELEFSKLRSTLETELEALDKFICEQTQNTTEQHWSVLDAEIERTKEVLAAEEEFYRLEIPRLCDAQCNGAVKTLKKHRQDFDLDLKTVSALFSIQTPQYLLSIIDFVTNDRIFPFPPTDFCARGSY